MGFPVPSIVLVPLLAAATLPVSAQDRETQEERVERREADREAIRRSDDEEADNNAFFDAADSRAFTLDLMWDEFRANSERAPEMRLRLLVNETQELAGQIEELYATTVSGDWSSDRLDAHSIDMADTIDRLRDLVNFGSDPPLINVAPLPKEGLPTRTQRLVILSRRLIPNLLFLAGDTAYDLNLLNQIRDDLAISEALTRVLPLSEF